MSNKEIMLHIVRVSNVKEETLEQLAERISCACKEAQEQKAYLSLDKPTPTTFEFDNAQEEKIKRIITRASQSLNPEKDADFLVAIPDLHCSWFALKAISKSKRLQEIYAVIMLALYQGQIPMEAETRILCLDDTDSFTKTLNKCGQEWSRRAKTIMRTQHPALYDELFEASPLYFSFID